VAIEHRARPPRRARRRWMARRRPFAGERRAVGGAGPRGESPPAEREVAAADRRAELWGCDKPENGGLGPRVAEGGAWPSRTPSFEAHRLRLTGQSGSHGISPGSHDPSLRRRRQGWRGAWGGGGRRPRRRGRSASGARLWRRWCRLWHLRLSAVGRERQRLHGWQGFVRLRQRRPSGAGPQRVPDLGRRRLAPCPDTRRLSLSRPPKEEEGGCHSDNRHPEPGRRPPASSAIEPCRSQVSDTELSQASLSDGFRLGPCSAVAGESPWGLCLVHLAALSDRGSQVPPPQASPCPG
jgi:hypothetical protein